MNHCPEFEERLLDYDTLEPVVRRPVDSHVSACAGCAEFLRALAIVDHSLTLALVAGERKLYFDRLPEQTMPPAMPSFWPIVFEGIGWTSLAGIGVAVTAAVAPGLVGVAVAAMGIAFASWVGFEGWRELN